MRSEREVTLQCPTGTDLNYGAIEGYEEYMQKQLDHIKKHVEQSGRSYNSLARATGLDVGTISRTLNGITVPTFKTMYLIMFELGYELALQVYKFE